MRVVDLKQNSPEWMQWRNARLGGSDAAAVMGVSPYCSREQLLQEKLGRARREENYAMRQGIYHEEMVRLTHCERVGMSFWPICLEHDEIPWMAASLDGLSDEGVILEIKCPNWKDHDFALNGQVPPHYWPQVQHQLFVAGADLLHYVSHSLKPGNRFSSRDQTAWVVVRPNPEYLARLLSEEEEFMAEWESKK